MAEHRAAKRGAILGLDIGGANVKAVRLEPSGEIAGEASIPLELWRDPSRLVEELRGLNEGLDAAGCSHAALTLTGELCDSFSSKREGVNFICGAVREAFPGLAVLVLDVESQTWERAERVAEAPLRFAANNWLASALHVATRHPDGLLMDVGSTTTDIIPIVNGAVAARGRTDTQRLASGELVYTGILRANPDTLVRSVPVGGGLCRVAAERFCLMADVHLLLGNITPRDYTCPTADGRGTSLPEARQRLARLVCADHEAQGEASGDSLGEALGHAGLLAVAMYVYEAQLHRLTGAALQVLSSLAEANAAPAVVLAAGSGAFVAEEVGRRLGMEVLAFPSSAGRHGPVLPALAAAILLENHLRGAS
jgi:probable H4MPT-linked C1 transfer pathway protein